MRNLKFLLLVFISYQCYAQQRFKDADYYILPEFTKGEVVMNNGIKKQGVFNYNSYSRNFDFLKDENIFTFDTRDRKRIDSVFIGDRRFVKKDDQFFEILLESNVLLYVNYECRLKSSATAKGAYGSSSQTGSSTSATTVYRDGLTYFVEQPHLYDVNMNYEYWINRGGNLQNFKTLGQLKRLYKKQKSEIKAYKKKNDIDFDEPDTVKKLVEHLEALK